jgi:N-acylneuraminate cytidylyltransferase
VIGNRTVLGLIPARGGSKGIPRKNLRRLAGKPLLEWTAEAALTSRFIDRAVLSTDDAEIAAVGASLGLDVPFERPAAAASDTASAADVISHAIGALGRPYDYLVYLEPTTPLRLAADIDACLERMDHHGAEFCVSLQRSQQRPEWMFYLGEEEQIEPAVGRFQAGRRQDMRECYVLNGAVYAARIESFLRTSTFLTASTLGYIMPPERSIDLDEPADFDTAEAILRSRGAHPG